jgi:hypothetical protein
MLAHLIAALKPASKIGAGKKISPGDKPGETIRMARPRAYRQIRFAQCRLIVPLAASQLRYRRETLIHPFSHVGQMFLLSSFQIEQ